MRYHQTTLMRYHQSYLWHKYKVTMLLHKSSTKVVGL